MASDLCELARIERSAARIFAGTHMAWAVTGATLPEATVTAAFEHGLLFVADVGEIVGFVAATFERERVYVEELSVARDRQRQGIGRSLLSSVVDAARARGARAVGLVTDRSLPWNRAFYEATGFRIVADEGDGAWLVDRMRRDAAGPVDRTVRCAMLRRFGADD